MGLENCHELYRKAPWKSARFMKMPSKLLPERKSSLVGRWDLLRQEEWEYDWLDDSAHNQGNGYSDVLQDSRLHEEGASPNAEGRE
jgi:hypothetical protein